MRRQRIEQRPGGHRPDRLHRHVVAPQRLAGDALLEDRLEAEERPAQVAVERRDRHITERREREHRPEVRAVERAARIAVRIEHDRPRAAGRQDRGIAGPLHARNDVAVRQRIVGARVRRRRRVADDGEVGHGGAAVAPEELIVDGNRVRVDERVGGFGQQVGRVARRSVAARQPAPVVARRLERPEAPEVLRDVAARDRVRTRPRDRRDDRERIGAERGQRGAHCRDERRERCRERRAPHRQKRSAASATAASAPPVAIAA